MDILSCIKQSYMKNRYNIIYLILFFNVRFYFVRIVSTIIRMLFYLHYSKNMSSYFLSSILFTTNLIMHYGIPSALKILFSMILVFYLLSLNVAFSMLIRLFEFHFLSSCFFYYPFNVIDFALIKNLQMNLKLIFYDPIILASQSHTHQNWQG